MWPTLLINLKNNPQSIFKFGAIIILLLGVGVCGYFSYALSKPVIFSTTGGASPQEKVLNDALNLLTNQTLEIDNQKKETEEDIQIIEATASSPI